VQLETDLKISQEARQHIRYDGSRVQRRP